jgi:O-succinylbenzoic acid--CoA ligase
VSDERDGRRRPARGWRFADWVTRRARRSPETAAVVDAETRLTYAALDDAVAQTAGRLAALGVERDDHLGLVVGTRRAAAAVVHAAARLGATLVPVDPRGDADAVRERLDRAGVTAVVCERPTATVVADVVDGLPVATVDETTRDGVRSLPAVDPAPASVTPVELALDDRLLVLYTSGTTGDPKPVVLTAGNVLASATSSALRLGVAPGDRWLCELPAYHMGGIAPFYRTAIYGTTAVLVERERLPEDDDAAPTDASTGRAGFDAERTLRAMHEHAVTGASLVPTQLRRLLDAADATEGPDTLPDSLRFVLLGGGPAPDALVECCDARDTPVCPTYGLTETASQVTTATPDEATDYVGTVGRPLAFTDVLVARESETDDTRRSPATRGPPGYRPCAGGESGEILVRGPTVTPGYYDAPERTAAAFAGEWFRTGDRGRLVDGRLYVAGRRVDRIVSGGENVDPAAVADAIRTVDGVRAAVVVGVPDAEWGEHVAALVVPDAERPGLRVSVVDACRERLPAHAVPRTVRMVETLPRTVSGTVDREAARDLLVGEE